MKEKEQDLAKYRNEPIKEGIEKPVFYQNTERLSEGVPGAGHYCPHLPSNKKERLDKTDVKFWKNKHK